MKYYDNDPETCCKYVQEVLESALNDIYKILNINKQETTYDQINNLDKVIPLELEKEYLIIELHNLRIIAYGHKFEGIATEFRATTLVYPITCPKCGCTKYCKHVLTR